MQNFGSAFSEAFNNTYGTLKRAKADERRMALEEERAGREREQYEREQAFNEGAAAIMAEATGRRNAAIPNAPVPPGALPAADAPRVAGMPEQGALPPQAKGIVSPSDISGGPTPAALPTQGALPAQGRPKFSLASMAQEDMLDADDFMKLSALAFKSGKGEAAMQYWDRAAKMKADALAGFAMSMAGRGEEGLQELSGYFTDGQTLRSEDLGDGTTQYYYGDDKFGGPVTSPDELIYTHVVPAILKNPGMAVEAQLKFGDQRLRSRELNQRAAEHRETLELQRATLAANTAYQQRSLELQAETAKATATNNAAQQALLAEQTRQLKFKNDAVANFRALQSKDPLTNAPMLLRAAFDLESADPDNFIKVTSAIGVDGRPVTTETRVASNAARKLIADAQARYDNDADVKAGLIRLRTAPDGRKLYEVTGLPGYGFESLYKAKTALKTKGK